MKFLLIVLGIRVVMTWIVRVTRNQSKLDTENSTITILHPAEFELRME